MLRNPQPSNVHERLSHFSQSFCDGNTEKHRGETQTETNSITREGGTTAQARHNVITLAGWRKSTGFQWVHPPPSRCRTWPAACPAGCAVQRQCRVVHKPRGNASQHPHQTTQRRERRRLRAHGTCPARIAKASTRHQTVREAAKWTRSAETHRVLRHNVLVHLEKLLSRYKVDVEQLHRGHGQAAVDDAVQHLPTQPCPAYVAQGHQPETRCVGSCSQTTVNKSAHANLS